MQTVADYLRRWQGEASLRELSRRTGVDRTVLGDYLPEVARPPDQPAAPAGGDSR